MPATTSTSAASGKVDWKKREIGALWRRVKNNDSKEKYLVGTLNLKNIGFDKDVPVIIYTNKQKNKDAHPDLRVYLSEPKAAPAASAHTPAPTPAAKAPTAEPDLI